MKTAMDGRETLHRPTYEIHLRVSDQRGEMTLDQSGQLAKAFAELLRQSLQSILF